MSLLDVVFILVFVTTFALLIQTVILICLGRRAGARTSLRCLVSLVATYLAIVVLVSLLSPGRVLKIGDPQCSDDWCLAVIDARRVSADEQSQTYQVTFRIWSRARSRAQRERGIQVTLKDDRGRKYEPIADNSATPFDVLLQPQESIELTRRFELPRDARNVVLQVSRDQWFPGSFIIGCSESLFHKPSVTPIPE